MSKCKKQKVQLTDEQADKEKLGQIWIEDYGFHESVKTIADIPPFLNQFKTVAVRDEVLKAIGDYNEDVLGGKGGWKPIADILVLFPKGEQRLRAFGSIVEVGAATWPVEMEAEVLEEVKTQRKISGTEEDASAYVMVRQIGKRRFPNHAEQWEKHAEDLCLVSKTKRSEEVEAKMKENASKPGHRGVPYDLCLTFKKDVLKTNHDYAVKQHPSRSRAFGPLHSVPILCDDSKECAEAKRLFRVFYKNSYEGNQGMWLYHAACSNDNETAAEILALEERSGIQEFQQFYALSIYRSILQRNNDLLKLLLDNNKRSGIRLDLLALHRYSDCYDEKFFYSLLGENFGKTEPYTSPKDVALFTGNVDAHKLLTAAESNAEE